MKCPNCNNRISLFRSHKRKCVKCDANFECNTLKIESILVIATLFIIPAIYIGCHFIGASEIECVITFLAIGFSVYFLAIEIFGKCKVVSKNGD
jgi:hypothetical protein